MNSVTNLTELPIEILLKIFKYVGNRWNLSTVSLQFYDIVCEIEKEKFCLKLIDIKDDDKYLSIMNTKRTFNHIKIVNCRSLDHHVILRIKEVLGKFEEKVKTFEINSSTFHENEVVDILNELQNVENIIFYDLEYSSTDESNGILKLNNLQKFSFHLCNVKIPDIVLKLPDSTVQSLVIENCILKHQTLEKIFGNQGNIRELEFDPYYVKPQSMEHLKLRNVKLMCNRNVAALLKNQRGLENLDLSRAHISDSEFSIICTLDNLKCLKLWIDRVSCDILYNLRNLSKLNELMLNYDRLEIEYIRNISTIKIPSLRKLKIKFPRLKILSESFSEISLNMPNINYLNISNQSIGVLGTLIDSFKNLETLILGCDSDSPEVVDFPLNNVQHLKLKELCLHSSYVDQKTFKCSNTILEIINHSLINLEKLKLRNVIALDCHQLERIFSSHQKLSHFFIITCNPEVEFNDDFVKILRNYHKQLNYFQSRGSKIKIHKKNLEKNFIKEFSFVKIRPWESQIVLKNFKWLHADDD
ncbi:CLUMA_CG005028, isoform A [Clunio marinus]|uniref:CLUMA_CG005028, isoform A n=1 Tax=Clunio marinus TaxID=568069 RepID=A0A1J1HTN6_9DIPT|nr:CLUMA_CG005028, isoform A [Clunio marinus]